MICRLIPVKSGSRAASPTCTPPTGSSPMPGPDEAITAAIDQPGLRLPQIVRTVMEGYADRPALGTARRRVRQRPADRPHLGRAAAPLRHHHLPRAVGPRRRGRGRPGRRAIAVGAARRPRLLCWASPASTTRSSTWRWSDWARYRVPLQTSAPVTQLRPIVAETEPSVIAASIDYLDDAVELVADRARARAAGRVRLPPRGRRPARDVRRRPVAAGASGQPGESWKRWPTCSTAGRRCRPHRCSSPTSDDPLALLVYTSGSTGAPKGAMYPERLVANLWRRLQRAVGRDAQRRAGDHAQLHADEPRDGPRQSCTARSATAARPISLPRAICRLSSTTSRWCGPPS